MILAGLKVKNILVIRLIIHSNDGEVDQPIYEGPQT